ncbi:hypothetical protein ACHAPA_009532 [Fusarium lateritium]
MAIGAPSTSPGNICKIKVAATSGRVGRAQRAPLWIQGALPAQQPHRGCCLCNEANDQGARHSHLLGTLVVGEGDLLGGLVLKDMTVVLCITRDQALDRISSCKTSVEKWHFLNFG